MSEEKMPPIPENYVLYTGPKDGRMLPKSSKFWRSKLLKWHGEDTDEPFPAENSDWEYIVLIDTLGKEVLPTPPATHILYVGPKKWQALPDKSLFWHTLQEKWLPLEGLSAIPGEDKHYAIPLNVTLPPGYTPPDTTPDVLEEARDLIRGDRAESYGEARASFQRIADFWSTYKGVQFTPKDVASMMILLKISRGVTSAKRDNWVDILGYGALGSEMDGANA